MVLSFACVILIAMARSAADSTEESATPEPTPPQVFDSLTDEPLSQQDETATTASVASAGEGAFWLGVALCLCHAWLFSGIGVISRRLQHVHFTELMIH